MELLSHDQHPYSTDVCAVSLQPSRCTIMQLDDAIGVADPTRVFPPARSQMGTPSRGLVCTSQERPSSSLCDLEMGPASPRDRCHDDPLAPPGQAVYMPTLELDPSHPHQNLPGPDISNHHHLLVAVGNMVSDDSTHGHLQADQDTTLSSSTSNRPNSKRHRSQSQLVPGSMEHKMRRLATAGVD